MRLLFNSLKSVKKEARVIQKLTVKHAGKSLGLQSFQDLVATFYGWQHYNEMSYRHQAPGKAKAPQFHTSEIFTQGPGHAVALPSLSTMKHITELTDTERHALVARKSRLLEKMLCELELHQTKIEAILFEFFDKRSALMKFIDKTRGLHFSDLNQLPAEVLRRNFLCTGKDPVKAGRFYAGVPVSHAVAEGGLFILRQSVAKPVYEALVGSLGGDIDRLHVYDLTGEKGELGQYCRLDIFGLDDPETIENFFLAALANTERLSSSADGIWHSRMRIMLQAYIKALSAMREIDPMYSSVFAKRFSDHKFTFDMVYSEMIDLAYEKLKDNEGGEELRYHLFHFPGFDMEKAMLGEEQGTRFTEHLGYILMYFSSLITKNQEHHERYSDSPATPLPAILGKDNIALVVIPDETPYNFSCDIAAGILSMVRSAIAAPLSNELEFVVYRADNKPGRSGCLRPIVMDAYERYAIDGMSIVASQAATLGNFFFFGVWTVEAMKGAREEWCSLVANMSNRVVFDYYGYDDSLHVHKRMGIIDNHSGKMFALESHKAEPFPIDALNQDGYVYVSVWRPGVPYYHPIK